MTRAYIYNDTQTAEKVTRTMERMGLEPQRIGSVVIAHSGDFELLIETTMAPEPAMIAEVK
jgi:hypothetical protein